MVWRASIQISSQVWRDKKGLSKLEHTSLISPVVGPAL